AATTAFGGAPAGSLIQVDEYGNMLLNGQPGPAGVIGQDPVSGLFTLCYQLPIPVNPGDLRFFEPGGTTSDIIRFPGGHQMYFFSDFDPNEPADGSLAESPNNPPLEALLGPLPIQPFDEA